MINNLESPILPSVDIYQLRYTSNKILSFNQNIINYDFIIYSKIQKIVSSSVSINETIRGAIPKLKIKLSYILNSELNNDQNAFDIIDSTHAFDYLPPTDIIEDLIDFKLELDKNLTKLTYTTEPLQLIYLDEHNQQKQQQYSSQKETLVTSKNRITTKIDKLNQEYSVITAAEDIILKSKITDFLRKHILNDALIDSIDIPTSKKEILKLALASIKNMLSIIDDGLEFSQLVEVRINLANQILALKQEANGIDQALFKLTQLIPLADEITDIDKHKQFIIYQSNLIKEYWDSWCHFINEKITEDVFNFQQVNTESQILMNFLNDMEYQYQRQLPD